MKEIIKKKKLRLEEIKAELKTEFFGIDDVIDKIIQSVESWYIIPQALSNPMIINLWGLTGVGKTHLVRRLVQKLNFSSKFVEVQMDGYSNSSVFGKDSICSILQSSNISEGEPGILLLDEFQRYRTVDEDGTNSDIKRYQDVWMLLSDGKFSADVSLYLDIEREIANAEYYQEREDDADDEIFNKEVAKSKSRKNSKPSHKIDPVVDKKTSTPTSLKYAISYYQAQVYKRLLRLTESISTIMTWEASKLSLMCREALEKRDSEQIDYSKLLIFVCGNLDEAFRMAFDLENCDTDADVFYQHSRKVSIINIKTSLKQRFKPEQIARLGNNHIIYPSLNKEAYRKIIRVACKKYINYVQTLKLNFTFDDKVYEEIYKNSVYPTQGARPVISSIHKFFSTVIPSFALWCLENDMRDIFIDIDSHNSVVYTNPVPNLTFSVPVELDIQEQKNKNTVDFNTLVAVHEAGHALVYSILTHYAPLEIAINLSSFKGGYNLYADESLNSKKEILNQIAILLAGVVAEELVFGIENRSSGCASDIDAATCIASAFHRNLGFGKIIAKSCSDFRSEEAFTNLEITNSEIEKMLVKGKSNAKAIILKHKEFLNEIINNLLHKNIISVENFIPLAEKYNISVCRKNTDVSTSYNKLWKSFNSN